MELCEYATCLLRVQLIDPLDHRHGSNRHCGSMGPLVQRSGFGVWAAEENKLQSLLAGDVNISGGGEGLEPHWSALLGGSIDAAWDGTVHGERGHIACADGSVRKL